jgi:hypothetical protein
MTKVWIRFYKFKSNKYGKEVGYGKESIERPFGD